MEIEMWRMRPCNLNKNNKKMKKAKKAEMNLIDLPREILIEIFKRVPAKSLCCIRCVCKTMLSIVNTPCFVTLHTRLLIAADFPHVPCYSSPELILRTHHTNGLTTYEGVVHFQSLNYDQGAQQLHLSQIFQTSTPLGRFYDVHFVFCNLFCMRYLCPNGHGFIINPLRGEVLRLPPTLICSDIVYDNMNLVQLFSDFTGMGFNSVTNTYKILRVSLMGNIFDEYSCEKMTVISQILVLGTSEWRRIPSAPPAAKFLRREKNVCAFGDVHWLINGYKREGMEGVTHILSFDFNKEDFFWIPSPYELPCSTLRLNLVSFRGSMAFVDTRSATSIEIWVMKDYNKKEWSHDYSIDIQNMPELMTLNTRFDFMRVVCGEWEHGILFMEANARRTLYLDLRPNAVTLLKHFICPTLGWWKNTCNRILSLSGSLISLKSYANLVGGEEEQPATYRNWSEGEASGSNFFYLTR